jgi:hypothetical protein
MNRVVPRYVPANTIEERFGFLVTAEKTEGGRVYLARSGGWSDIGDARFYDEPLHAADGLKEMRERAADGYSDVNVDTIELVRVVGMLIPTTISEAELRKQRRAEAMSKLSQDEIEALGLDKVNFEAMEKADARKRG